MNKINAALDALNEWSMDEVSRKLNNQPCGCADCDNGVQPGHFQCSQPSAKMLDLERRNMVARVYEDSGWKWVPIL